jgi:NADH dehydrogenase
MSNRATASLPHVVIVGAGFGGLQAALALKKAPVRVTIVDRKNHHLFQPLLYQVATAELSPADIAIPIRAVMRHQKKTEVIMAEVTGIDVEGRRVLMGERSVAYDYLVLATGSWHSYFGHNEWERYAPGLKSITDATSIRRKILLAFEAAEIEPDPEKQRALLTFVVVGGGPTGVEMAGAIAELARKSIVKDFRHINSASARIILVEAAPHILASFPPSLARKAQKKLERMGVEIKMGTPVTEVDAEGVRVDGEHIATKTVIWAAGVAASPAGRWLDVETDKAGRVMVLSDLTVPHHPEIFVIGDSAHIITNEKPLPGVAPVAMQQGRYVASVIRRRLKGDLSVRPFHYVDKGNLATVGRSFAIADVKHIHLSGFFAWVTWLVVHIFYLIGFRNRLFVMIQWAWAYFTYQRGARLITGEQEEAQRIPEMHSLVKQ